MDRSLWCLIALSMVLVVVAASEDSKGRIPFPEASEIKDGGVWSFTCDDYCAYCACVGNFLTDQNKCICSCDRDSVDLKCFDDVRKTKEFLGLNHTLEIRYSEPNNLERVSKVRVKRQAIPRRPFARKNPRRQRGPNANRQRPLPVARRPLRPRESANPPSPMM